MTKEERLEHAREYLNELLDKLHWASMDEYGCLTLPASPKEAALTGPKGLTYGDLIEIMLHEVGCMAGAMQERLWSLDQAYLP